MSRLAEASAGLVAHMMLWATRAGDRPDRVRLTGELARRIAAAVEQGHSCLPLSAEDARMARDCAVVGRSSHPGSHPLLIDPEGRLYLHRHFDEERRLAERVLALDGPAAPLPDPDAALRMLASLFPGDGAAVHGGVAAATAAGVSGDRQRDAADTALRRRLTLISGGPGTGKTSTVVKLLACLLAGDEHLRIALAAPTGKAAARMQEAIRERADRLPGKERALLPQQAGTVHRLLQQDPRHGGFLHGSEPRLPLDVVVIDEASMLDLALACRLFEALPENARLILLGDRDQLAAVQSGAVFAELAAQTGADARIEGVVELETQFRFSADAGIGAFAGAVRRGDAERALSRLAAGTPDLLWYLPEGPAGPSAGLEDRLASGYQAYWTAIEDGVGPVDVFAAFARFRVLCALRAGPWGAEALSAMIGRTARGRVEIPGTPGGRSAWYRGRPVMVLRNDPVLQLHNGDIGIALPDPEGELKVCFPVSGDAVRWVAPLRLPEHETAFAMSIHKSQGSEFQAVAVVLPPEPHPLLTRELLYTAITRAREQVLVVGAAGRIVEAVTTPSARDSGLLARLDEARLASRERVEEDAVGHAVRSDVAAGPVPPVLPSS